MADVPLPRPFLTVRVRELDLRPPLVAVCVGYEQKIWRSAGLAAHLMNWIPEFALTYREREAIRQFNAVELMNRAAMTVYTTEKTEKRGKIGELLLHVILRQVYATIPAEAKFYFKDASNDTVKGFDAVHVVPVGESLHLWFGEVKFYEKIESAISAVVEELKKHTNTDYLRSEFAAITNKIDPAWPHAEQLKKLLHRNTSLDEIFAAAGIAVLLTYDSDVIGKFDAVSEEFKAAFAREVLTHRDTFSRKDLPDLEVHLFLFPMKSKAQLVKDFDERLRAWQSLA